jgi:O-phosphoseryl-tRNA(Cys) synthetase
MTGLPREARLRLHADLKRGVRTCTHCGWVKPLSEFYKRKDKPAHFSECKSCFRARVREARYARQEAEKAVTIMTL